MLLETETIKEEVQALRDIASGSEVSAEDAEIADKAIIKDILAYFIQFVFYNNSI